MKIKAIIMGSTGMVDEDEQGFFKNLFLENLFFKKCKLIVIS